MYPDEHAKTREKLRQSQLKKPSCYVPLGVIPFILSRTAVVHAPGQSSKKRGKKKKKKEKYMHVTKVLGPLTCFLVLFPPSF